MPYYMYNSKYNQYAINDLRDSSNCIINHPDEIFVQVIWNGILVPRFLISNEGRFYDTARMTFPSICYDKDGYMMSSLNVNGVIKKVRLHRIELMSFNPIDNHSSMQVNHKDTNKQNNKLSNLEWTTGMDNTRHAIRMGLLNDYRVNNPNKVYSDERVHEICTMIDAGLTPSEICNYYGISDKVQRMRLSATISGIRNGKTHTEISSQYKFMSKNDYPLYNLDFAYLVCQFLTDGNEYTFKELADLLRIPNNERVCFVNYVGDLISGATAKTVVDQFPPLKRPLAKRTQFDYLY